MTAVGSADIHAIAEAMRKSGRDSKATTRRVLIEAANFLLTEMEIRVPVDSGELRQSLRVDVQREKIIVGPTAPYANYVEFGTKPHVIKPKKPGGVLRFNVGGQTVYAQVVNHPGTKAQPFVKPAFDAWVKTIGNDVAHGNVEYMKKEMKPRA